MKSSTLWALFILFLLETAGFGVIMEIWEFQVIDEMSDPEQVAAHIEEMSALQRTVHIWTTATLDVAYPLTYGPLFIGLALRFLPKIFALPGVLVIPTDLAEGVVQVMALADNMDLLWTKAYLTPFKLILFFAALAVSLVALGVAFRRRRNKNETSEG